jgi:23S rRNA pseudoU1915 N3-methylase RlmH
VLQLKSQSVICLDEHGRQYTSPEFTKTLFNAFETAPHLNFVIGAAEGLPGEQIQLIESIPSREKNIHNAILAHRAA